MKKEEENVEKVKEEILRWRHKVLIGNK